VPAVAVRQGRQVLFIFNRYIGYLDGVRWLVIKYLLHLSLICERAMSELLVER